MYSNFCLIGLGTVGGFLAKNLTDLETTKKLILIDYDKVKENNIKNSIFTKKDIGKPKVEVLKNKFQERCSIDIIKDKFIEGKTILKPDKNQLVIDCRDFTYHRKELIDVRLSISLRNLIIDCRKNVHYKKQHEGKYISRLTKTELNMAAQTAVMFMENEIFDQLLKKHIVHKIPIDSLTDKLKILIDRNSDIIYDNFDEDNFINLSVNYTKIIEMNKEKDLIMYIGDKHLSYTETIIPKNNLRNIQDIIFNFVSLTKKLPTKFNFYIVSVSTLNDKYYVELLPEIGSA